MQTTGLKKYLKMIRPFDWIIVGLLMIGAFIPYGVFAYHEHQANQVEPNRVLTAIVKHDGKEIYRLKLTNHKGTTRYRFKDGDEWNEIVATDNKIAITEANCQDQVCVRKGEISHAGESIVCLPHKLLIQINASSGSQDGGLVTE